ncbi:unnamed protein product [Urochloa humidicola]
MVVLARAPPIRAAGEGEGRLRPRRPAVQRRFVAGAPAAGLDSSAAAPELHAEEREARAGAAGKEEEGADADAAGKEEEGEEREKGRPRRHRWELCRHRRWALRPGRSCRRGWSHRRHGRSCRELEAAGEELRLRRARDDLEVPSAVGPEQQRGRAAAANSRRSSTSRQPPPRSAQGEARLRASLTCSL